MCRRDSFITHRAFCDALTEENNKVNQGALLMNNIGSSSLQTQMSDQLIMSSSLPMNTTTNTSIGTSEIDNLDPKNPLKSLSQEANIPMSFKSMNMAGGMFSTSSGTLFGGPRTSSSSSLQLNSSNGSSSFNYLQDSKNGCQVSGSAHMSATALLQKAAQMGATASNSINSPMMQKSFVSSMAGPGGILQQHNPSYEHFQPQPPDQSNMVGMTMNGGGFTNQLLQKGQQDISHLFDANTTASTMNDMYSHFMQKDDSNSSSSLTHARTAVEISSAGRLVASGEGNNTMTLDLLGIGGSSRPVNLHEHQQQQQQHRLELEALMEPAKVANYESFPTTTHTWGFRN